MTSPLEGSGFHVRFLSGWAEDSETRLLRESEETVFGGAFKGPEDQLQIALITTTPPFSQGGGFKRSAGNFAEALIRRLSKNLRWLVPHGQMPLLSYR